MCHGTHSCNLEHNITEFSVKNGRDKSPCFDKLALGADDSGGIFWQGLPGHERIGVMCSWPSRCSEEEQRDKGRERSPHGQGGAKEEKKRRKEQRKLCLWVLLVVVTKHPNITVRKLGRRKGQMFNGSCLTINLALP
jgi:hypothetical protein